MRCRLPHLLLVNDARGSDALDLCSECEEGLDLLLGDVVGHDDSCTIEYMRNALRESR